MTVTASTGFDKESNYGYGWKVTTDLKLFGLTVDQFLFSNILGFYFLFFYFLGTVHNGISDIIFHVHYPVLCLSGMLETVWFTSFWIVVCVHR